MNKNISIDTSDMVHNGSDFHAHEYLYKTLDLLCLFSRDGTPVYFITEGLGSIDGSNPLNKDYWFDTHTCPVNYIGVEGVMTPTDTDPHGIFDYIRSVWMPADYVGLECDSKYDRLLELFPEISTCAKSQTDIKS